MKIAMVTGATAGFGEAIVRKLVVNNYFVIGTGRRTQKLEQLKQELGENFYPLAFDVSDKQQVVDAFTSLPENLQQIDLLVNNAGLALGLDPAQKGNLDEWDIMIDTNCKGLIYMCRMVLPSMVERNQGHIINIGSIAGTYPYPGGNIYGATKAFVKQFSLNLRADLANTNVRVTNVEPGLCGGTEFSYVRFNGDESKVKNLYDNVDYVTSEDIANAVLFLNQQPEHVNVNSIEIMPTAQTFNPLYVSKEMKKK